MSTFIEEPNVPVPVQPQSIIAALESPQTAVLLHKKVCAQWK